MSNTIDLTRDWFKTKQELDKLKKQEIDLRKLTIEANFGSEFNRKGTHKASLSNESELSLSVSEKVTLDKEAFVKHKPYLESLGLIGDDKLIKMTPSVSLSALKHLDDNVKATLSDLFVYSLSAPQLKVNIIKS